jgi:hypothetical protein
LCGGIRGTVPSLPIAGSAPSPRTTPILPRRHEPREVPLGHLARRQAIVAPLGNEDRNLDLRDRLTQVHGHEVGIELSADAAEDDGYVLAFAHNPERGASDLVILAAQEFTGDPVAIVHLPARVPLGFHGSWIPDN